jgi:hypothetical protein
MLAIHLVILDAMPLKPSGGEEVALVGMQFTQIPRAQVLHGSSVRIGKEIHISFLSLLNNLTSSILLKLRLFCQWHDQPILRSTSVKEVA